MTDKEINDDDDILDTIHNAVDRGEAPNANAIQYLSGMPRKRCLLSLKRLLKGRRIKRQIKRVKTNNNISMRSVTYHVD